MDDNRLKLEYATPGQREAPPSHRLIHVEIVLGCGFVGMVIMCGSVLFHGLLAGPTAFIYGTLSLALLLPLIFLVGVSQRTSSRRFKQGLAIACLAPVVLLWGTCYGVDCWVESKLPFDRFRDNLTDPIPASVTDVQFVPLEERIDPELMLRFKIAKSDLDRIIEQNHYEKIQPGHFRHTTDRFNDPNYLKIGADDEFFQGADKWGDVGTLKVNGTHTAAVFRRESSFEYK